MNKATIWMIVQSNNSKHIDNFNKINQNIHVQYFPAIQSREHYQIFSDFSIHKNYFDKNYVNKLQENPDSLGENLSHMLLFNTILEKSSNDWNLIIDGTIELNTEKFINEYDKILNFAEENNSEFIQLYMPTKFLVMNGKCKTENQEIYDLSLPIKTDAYFIHKTGIFKFIEEYPLKNSVSDKFGSMIQTWKSLYWKNDCFKI